MNLFELFIKIGVDDQASGKLSKLSSSLGKGLATAAKIGTAAVGAAATGIAALTKSAVDGFAEYEQLAGGAAKIFNEMSQTDILRDAQNAYKELGLSANQYLAVINDVGATFAATMGDKAGYEAAKTGLKAISDYASGTGKNVNELSQKFTLITRSTASYQSIADQFSGILPATSAGFLEQAQAAGFLSDSYKQLTEVPIAEYQEAVSKMLEQGVADLGLANNTMDEAFTTLSGSLAMAKGAWSNLVTGLADDSADLDMLIGNFVESAATAAKNVLPRVTQILNGVSSLVTQMAPVLSNAIPVIISEVLPGMVSAGVQLIQSLLMGISQNIDAVTSGAVQIIMMLSSAFLSNLPTIISVGMQLIIALANGLAQSAPQLIPVIAQAGATIVLTLLQNIPAMISAGWDLLKGLIQGLGNAITSLFPGFGEALHQHLFAPLDDALGLIGEYGGKLISFLWDGIVSVASKLFPGLSNLLSRAADEAVASAGSSLQGMAGEAQAAAEGAMQAAADAVMSAPELIPVDASSPVSVMAENMSQDTRMEEAGITAVENASSSMEAAVNTAGFDNAGKTAMQNFIRGINSMRGAVMSAVDSIASQAVARMQSALNQIQSMANSARVPGFATGLDYVPYDDFLARLHKGEAVLTASEAASWRAGKTENVNSAGQNNSNGITIIQNIQSVPQTPAEFSATTAAYFEQARWAMA